MFLQNEKTEYYSGYIEINENLQIEEISGHINQILRTENIDQNDNLLQIIEVLKKNTRSFFREEVLPAITSRQIRHFSFERKNTIVSIAVTPIASGLTIISFEEIPAADKYNQQSLPEKLKEILIRINPDLKVIFVSKN
jgi:hypothetical protein